ncbi:MAG TPA: chondroitinase-B domain-containing protein [Phycisphaerae bacterium]|nr:chondroitinase-B domain-containing protein [Phycisphaerae bacterium]
MTIVWAAGLVCFPWSTSPAAGVEYFVAPGGNDEGAGTSTQDPWKTIQFAVNRLKPGDTLTLGPGEYVQRFAVRQRASADKPVRIRAAIPGLTVLRGDVPIRDFQQVAGTRFVWSVRSDRWVYRVVEMDTGRVFLEAPSPRDMDQFRESFLYDRSSWTLYVHTSDGRSPADHVLIACVTPSPAVEIAGEHIIVDGLVVRGFTATRFEESRRGYGMKLGGQYNTVRRCGFLYNQGGVIIGSQDSVVSDSLFVSNLNPGSSLAQLFCTVGSERMRLLNNRVLGFNLYGIRNYEGPRDSVAIGNIVRDNYWGLDFKASEGKNRIARNNVAVECEYLNFNSGSDPTGPKEDFNTFQLPSLWWNKGPSAAGPNTLVFDPAKQDPRFADPGHLDYRLQADSPFRGKGPGGSDLGAYPYEPNVLYVSPSGGDDRDGLSAAQALKTIDKAIKVAGEGFTIYLLDGHYEEDVAPTVSGSSNKPLAIRGRGENPQVWARGLELRGVRHVRVEHVRFRQGGTVRQCEGIVLDRCAFFDSPRDGLVIEDSLDVQVRRVTFWNSAGAAVAIKGACDGLRVTSSILHSKTGPALIHEGRPSGLFCEYNNYLPGEGKPVAVVSGKACAAVTDLRATTGSDARSFSVAPYFANGADPIGLAPNSPCVGAGELAEPVGAGEVVQPEVKQIITEVKLRDITPTSASLTWWTPNMRADMWRRPSEWWLNFPVYSEVQYGETQEYGRSVHSFGFLYHRVTLHGLKPDTTYHFRIVSHDHLWEDSLYRAYGPAEVFLRLKGAESEPLAFRTPSVAAWKPTNRTLHVSPDGRVEDSGLEESAPTTLTAASDRVRAGDTVILLDGVYTELFAPAASGTAEAAITLKARTAGRAVLDGSTCIRPAGVALFWKNHIVIDGVVLRLFGDSVYGRRAGLTNCQVFLARCENVTLRNCVLMGFSPGITEAGLIARGGGPLTITNCVIGGFMHGVNARAISRVDLIGNTWYVPLIDNFYIQGRTVVKNNLFLGQERQKVFSYVPMVSNLRPAEADYNAYYFGPSNHVRHIGYGIKHKDERDMGGVARVQQELGLDLHSIEPSYEDVRLSGPAPTEYLDRNMLNSFGDAVEKRQLVPTLDMFDPPANSRLNTAGENGEPIGSRSSRAK